MRYKSVMNIAILAISLILAAVSGETFKTENEWRIPYQDPPNVKDLTSSFYFDLIYSYKCKIALGPNNTRMQRMIAAANDMCEDIRPPVVCNTFDEVKRAFLKFNEDSYSMSLGYFFKEGEDEYSGEIQILSSTYYGVSDINNFFVENYFSDILPEYFDVSGNISAFSDEPKPEDEFMNKMIYPMLPGAALGLILALGIFQLHELQETKMMQLLIISGVGEHIIWIILFINDFALILLWSIIVAIPFTAIGVVGDYSLYFLECLLSSLTNLIFNYAFGQLMQKKWLVIIYMIAFLSLEIFLPCVNQIFTDQTPEYVFVLLQLLLPPMQLSLFVLNHIHSHSLDIVSTWSTLDVTCYITTSKLFGLTIASFFIYLLIFLLFLLMNNRLYGAPLIGWVNIFKPKAWKALFRKKVVYKRKEDASFISVHAITKTYKGRIPIYALKGVSFDIAEGESILLIGPNGCGKTTMLNGLTGFNKADSGELKIFGHEAANSFYDIQDYLGICFQENVFFPNMTVKDHLLFFALIRGTPQEEVEKVMTGITDRLDIGECLNSKAKDLSGGQKRKLCIAMAIVGSSPLVVLDEPTAGIDVSTRQVIWKTLASYRDMTLLISTHSLEEAESVSSRIFVMRDGELIFQGSANELRQQYKCGYRLNLMGDIKEEKIERLKEAINEMVSGTTIDPQRNDCILIPVVENMSSVVEFVDQHLAEYGFEGYTIIVEELEHVLSRMIVEDEN